MEEKSFFQKNKRSLIVLILVNLAISTCIILGDLHTLFESYGGILLRMLLEVQIVFSAILLTSIIYKSIKKKNGSPHLFFFLILVTVVFIWLMPSLTVKILAPTYDSYFEKRASAELTRIIPLYKEPAYLPPQITIDGKKINTALVNGEAHIKTTYRCIDSNGYPWHGNTIWLELNSSNKPRVNDDYEPGVVIQINDKDTFLYDAWGNASHLILYDETVSVEMYVPADCKINTEEVIKIMESLQPAMYKDAILFKQKPKGPEDRFFD